MPFYEVITPLDQGAEEVVAPGETVELSKKTGDALVAVGALKPGKKPTAKSEAGA
jgi:hypothetical protein